MSVTSDLPGFSLNALTGGPLLRLLLAIRGEEPPSLDPELAWDVFKHFARIPTDQRHDLISFQATWTPEDVAEAPDPPTFYITWSRELAADDAYASFSRAIQMQWCFDPQGDVLQDVELWSDSYADLNTFFAEVERLPEFRALMISPSTVELYTTDLDE